MVDRWTCAESITKEEAELGHSIPILALCFSPPPVLLRSIFPRYETS